jgi:hypothetical protein
VLRDEAAGSAVEARPAVARDQWRGFQILLRDSIDDYEYLAMLVRLGRASEAEQIVLSVAPSWFQGEPEPAVYEPARAKLAQLILASKN